MRWVKDNRYTDNVHERDFQRIGNFGDNSRGGKEREEPFPDGEWQGRDKNAECNHLGMQVRLVFWMTSKVPNLCGKEEKSQRIAAESTMSSDFCSYGRILTISSSCWYLVKSGVGFEDDTKELTLNRVQLSHPRPWPTSYEHVSPRD